MMGAENEVITHEGMQYRKVEREAQVGDKVVVTRGSYWSKGMEGRVLDVVDGQEHDFSEYPDDEVGAVYVPKDSSPGGGMPFLSRESYATLEPLKDAAPAATMPKLTDAKPGDRVRIIAADDKLGVGYQNGDVYTVKKPWANGLGANVFDEHKADDFELYAEEFEVVRELRDHHGDTTEGYAERLADALIQAQNGDVRSRHYFIDPSGDVTDTPALGDTSAWHAVIDGKAVKPVRIELHHGIPRENTPHDNGYMDADAEAAMFAEQQSADNVEKPAHYNAGNVEVIEIIEDITSQYSDGFVSYSVGNCLKYCARAPHKHSDNGLEDLKKAKKYLEFAISRIEKGDAGAV